MSEWYGVVLLKTHSRWARIWNVYWMWHVYDIQIRSIVYLYVYMMGSITISKWLEFLWFYNRAGWYDADRVYYWYNSWFIWSRPHLSRTALTLHLLIVYKHERYNNVILCQLNITIAHMSLQVEQTGWSFVFV